MTHNRNPLWYWEAFPATGYNPNPQPRIDAWHHATPCEAPTINEYPYKPWDIHYDRRRDPAMIVLDANEREIWRRDQIEAVKLDRIYKSRVKWRTNKREV